MSQSNVQVRRATVDDLPVLRQLWSALGLPAAELERRFAEFQLVEQDAHIVAAIGLQVANSHGWLHSEVMCAGQDHDQMRTLLWERLQNVVRNHGLARLWTRELAPFWAQRGFVSPEAGALGRLPAVWAGAGKDGWLTLKLKDEALVPSLDQEFAVFKQAAREENEALLRQAKVLKMVALFVAFLVFALIVVGTVLYFANRTKLVR